MVHHSSLPTLGFCWKGTYPLPTCGLLGSVAVEFSMVSVPSSALTADTSGSGVSWSENGVISEIANSLCISGYFPYCTFSGLSVAWEWRTFYLPFCLFRLHLFLDPPNLAGASLLFRFFPPPSLIWEEVQKPIPVINSFLLVFCKYPGVQSYLYPSPLFRVVAGHLAKQGLLQILLFCWNLGFLTQI